MGTFFAAKLACDLIPMRVIPTIIFSVISYPMIGLESTTAHFLVFLLTIFMVNVFGSAMCFLIAASVSVFGKIYVLSSVEAFLMT